jgi:uncharacterized protein YjbI with pentapeptide repeats
MRIVKATKLPVLTRVVEVAQRPVLHAAAIIGFPLSAPRALVDELACWAITGAQLGEQGMLDESVAKVRAELLVAGAFHALAGKPVTASHVRARVGNVDKRLAVVGDRWWRDGIPSEPEPMVAMPIDWTHAFGGPRFGRNPYGKGAELVEVDGRKLRPLPNVEPFGNLMRAPSESPEPAGFRPLDVTFEQRRKRSGTYDRRWLEEHFPGLPPDMDPGFFNVAPEDQWLQGFWRGDEEFLVENMHPDTPRIQGQLPGLVARAFVTQRTAEGERFVEIPLRCDTVWLFPSADFGAVILHGALGVADDDAADILHLVAACEEAGRPRPAEHYQAALVRRLDPDEGALAGLSDSDLMPSRESGVASNIGEMDLGRWLKGENLAAAHGRRGAERQRAKARAETLAEGLDPKSFGLDDPLPEEPAPLPDDLDQLVAYVQQQEALTEELGARAEEEEARAKERARQDFAEMGLDYDVEAANALRENAGPPRFSAAAHYAQLLRMSEESREVGTPIAELERQLADPQWQAALVEQERELRDVYRSAAHLQPSPAPMSAEASERARALAEAAIGSGERLAERDFTGANLAGVRLRGLDLSRALLEASDLAGCDLSGANLEGAVLAKANLTGANLTGARLRGANLGGATLHRAVLDAADLTDAILSRAELAGASFAGATLEGADLLFTKFDRADLSGAKLPGVTVVHADLCGVRFVDADVSDSDFIECQLDGADFSRAKMHQTTFVACRGSAVRFCAAELRQGIFVHGSAFPKADFSDATMEKANLRGTSLVGAVLDRANLEGADLSECDATEASFDRAVLTGGMMIRTKLVRASLQGANLMDVLLSKAEVQGASFTGANLFRADMSRARGDDATRLTDAEVTQVRVLPKASPNPGGGR